MYVGAGKTSTFNMLTGDLRPSSGTAVIADYDILTQLRKVSTGSILCVGEGGECFSAGMHVYCSFMYVHMYTYTYVHTYICTYIHT